MQIFYHIGLLFYLVAARIVSVFGNKAKLFVDGRRGLYRKIADEYHPSKPVIWFHCSSVGEFEQARPIIEKIRKDSLNYQILVTFFSPSGYELRKNYELADWVFYLPLDTKWDARKFVSAIAPAKVVFIKYEFWMNFLNELKKRHIHTYIACAVFRPGQIFFRWYGGVMRKVLRCFDRIFVQDNNSKKLLGGIGVNNVDVCGDTRFDRVYEILKEHKEGDPIVEAFSRNQKTLVAGSTWWDDEIMLSEAAPSYIGYAKLVLVPHETDENHIRKIEKLFSPYDTVRYSELASIKNPSAAAERMNGSRVLIVDIVGILSIVYRYARFSYIGGGFTKSGIHNILESATYGVPVIFGPIYGKFREACELVELGGAVSVSKPSSLERIVMVWMAEPAEGVLSQCELASEVCRKYVADNLGATEKICGLLSLGGGVESADSK